MRARSVKPIAALALTGVGTALVVGFRTTDPALITGSTAFSDAGTVTATPVGPAGGTSGGVLPTATAGAATPTASAGAATPAPPATRSSARYADGTWTGTAMEEPWGTFQVQAVIDGGRLADVVVVSEPGDRHSRRINAQAVPWLTEAAIAAQGTAIDMISGATWTSESYLTSLQAALDAAHAAVDTTG